MAGGNLMNLVGMKVLIVDDMQENLDTLVMIMESEGYKVATATNGNTALETASDFQPDLVLLDVKMDGIDGFETCRQFKQNGFGTDIPVIFITVRSEAKDITEGFLCGGVDYIKRPFLVDEVCARVRTHLHLRALMKQQKKLILELQEAIDKVKTLRGLLPICAWCKKIRDDSGYWHKVEAYIRDNSEANFTHCLCPNCKDKFFPE